MRPWHIIVVVLVFLLFFGIPKLPELARSIGRSLRVFKSETKGLMDDDVRGKAEAQTTRQELRDAEAQPLSGQVVDPVNNPAKDKDKH